MLDLSALEEIKDFTSHEKIYLDNLRSFSYTDGDSIEDNRERRLFLDYRNFLYNIMKYRNLKLEDNGTIAKRLIKVNRYLDTSLLEKENYDLIKFSGIYLAVDVMFLDPSIYYYYRNNPHEYTSTEKWNLPDNVVLRNMHLVTDSDNNSMAVALMGSELSTKYLLTHNSWKFPIF